MRLSRIQFSVRRLMVAVAGLAILLSFAVGAIEKWRLETDRWREGARFGRLFRMLYSRAPQGIDYPAWDDTLQQIYMASYSSGLSESRRGVEEMGRVCDDLEEKLKGEVGPETLRWLWERFARTGKVGEQYTKEYQRGFERSFKLLSADRGPTRQGVPSGP
jgi:hypothetical protein